MKVQVGYLMTFIIVTLLVLPSITAYSHYHAAAKTKDEGDEKWFSEAISISWSKNRAYYGSFGGNSDYINGAETMSQHRFILPRVSPNTLVFAGHGLGKKLVVNGWTIVSTPWGDIKIITNPFDAYTEEGGDKEGSGYNLWIEEDEDSTAWKSHDVDAWIDNNAQVGKQGSGWVNKPHTLPGSLVLILACYSGCTPKNGEDPLHEVFTDRGALCYVGFKDKILIEGIYRFSERFWQYTLFSKDTVLDAAKDAAEYVNDNMLNYPGAKGQARPVIRNKVYGELKNGEYEWRKGKYYTPFNLDYKNLNSVLPDLSEGESLITEMTIDSHPGYRDIETTINFKAEKTENYQDALVRIVVTISYPDDTPTKIVYFPRDQNQGERYKLKSHNPAQSPSAAGLGTSNLCVTMWPGDTKARATIKAEIFCTSGGLENIEHFDIYHKLCEKQ